MINTEKNIGAVIFSRFDSRRLFGKALRKINGVEVLGRVIERAKHIPGLSQIVVATSNREIDDPIVEYAKKWGVKTYRGCVSNVAQRASETCVEFGFEAFLRVCGDRPFFDPNIAYEAISLYNSSCFDMVTSTGVASLPEGLTCEVVNAKSLKNHMRDFSEYDIEHVTSFFYKHQSSLNIGYIKFPDLEKYSGKTKLVIDEDIDLLRAEEIASMTDNMTTDDRLSARINLEFAMNWEMRHTESRLEEK